MSSVLSIVILSAFTILGLIVLPALAEFRAGRADSQPPQILDDVRMPEDDESDGMLQAA